MIVLDIPRKVLQDQWMLKYGGKGSSSILYTNVLRRNFSFATIKEMTAHIFACSQQDSADSGVRRRYGDDVRYQRLDEVLLKDEYGEEHQDTFILICGTKSFDKDMVNYLRRLGVPETNYFRF